MSQVPYDANDPDKRKGKSWRDYAYDKPVNNNQPWRANSNYKYTNAIGVTDAFQLIRDNRIATKKEIDNKLPVEFTDVTEQEAQKIGYCEQTRSNMNAVRGMKRNQFYASRGIKNHDE